GRVADIGVVVGQLLGLLVDGLGHLGATVADVHAVKAGEGVDQLAAFVILDANTRGAGDDASLEGAAGMVMGMGGRVHEMGTVLGEQLVVVAHGKSSGLAQ